MTKKLQISKSNNKSILYKTKKLINIKNKILIQEKETSLEVIDDSWIKIFWDWADEKGINNMNSNLYDEDFRNDKNKLLNLERLIIQTANLTSLPKEISNFTKLKVIDLSYNSFREFPKEICNFNDLEYLSFWNNKLQKIPNEIGNLIKLERLSLNENYLIRLPKEIGNLINLKYLDIGMNHIVNIPKEIGNLKNLNELRFWNNYIWNQQISLPKEISNLNNLKKLTLSCINISNLPEEIINIINLDILEIGGNEDLILSKIQQKWIVLLQDRGCDIDMDDGLLDKK
jgi:Leucine-rich repeat (LRR) protein